MIKNTCTIVVYVFVIVHSYFIEYSNEYFHLYETSSAVKNGSIDYHDCFYAVPSLIGVRRILLRSYCIRPVKEELNFKNLINESDILDKRFTFSQLVQLNITGENLYEWSIPIDTIEQYQLYRANLSVQNGFIYNCSSPLWFGTFCQYTLNSLISFSEILIERLHIHGFNELEVLDMTNGTCYVLLKCNRGPKPMCLDWREICDGRCDCINECVDEEHCFHLETNECEKRQFRCNNGMCIPDHLVLDGFDFPDCMDASDEAHESFTLFKTDCSKLGSFVCDILTCSWFKNFPCGDGECADYHLTSISSCSNRRDLLHTKAITMYDNSALSEKCWLSVICTLAGGLSFAHNCTHISSPTVECPKLFFFPSTSYLFNDIRFVYEAPFTPDKFGTTSFLPTYVCYNVERCTFLQPKILINNSVCQYFSELPLDGTVLYGFYHLHKSVPLLFERWCALPGLVITNNHSCHHPHLFHCKDTPKCISRHRIHNRVIDCYNAYDELINDSCSLNLSHRFHCKSDKKCIPEVLAADSIADCSSDEDILNSNRDLNKNIIFSKICDGFVELSSISLGDQNETDETNCQYWPCHTQYTHCDQTWNCPNGADELNCSYKRYGYNCGSNEHHCVLSNITFPGFIINEDEINNYSRLIDGCLVAKNADDKIVRCSGSMDEREYCRSRYPNEPHKRFRCWNDTKCINVDQVCNYVKDCPFVDDEKVCPWLLTNIYTVSSGYFTCRDDKKISRKELCRFTDACGQKEEAFICDLDDWNKPKLKYFTTGNNFVLYPNISIRNDERLSSITTVLQTEQENKNKNDILLRWYCNQGVLTHSFDGKFHCFCSPAYYGDRCQYQNEFIGVDLYVQRKSLRDQKFAFRIVIILLDNNKNILFQEHILFVSLCEKQYQIYLLYPHRPKLNTLHYSVRFDIYAIHRLHNIIEFRTSLYYEILFPFLPVNRLIVILNIPEKRAETSSCDNIQCQNGKCYKYDNLNQYYCRCDDGWFGKFYHQRKECHCSPQSMCTETGCVCPLGNTGRLCYVPEATSCGKIVCKNGGSCVLHDQRIPTQDSKCICSEEYEGEFCEKRRMRIIITFDNVLVPQSVIIYYLITRISQNPERLTQFKRIPVYENTIISYPPVQYHIAYVQFDNNYYLVYLNTIITNRDVITSVILQNRCPHIRELFDSITLSFHPLKRIKYYQLICQQNQHLRCFYDETQMCLCTKNHLTDCFDFDHNETSTCNEYDYCENNGKCYINDLKCPTQFLCVCKECYLGTSCQFMSSGSALTLDFIIGYHIQPKISLTKQPFVIKLSTGITIVMVLIGIIDNLICILTFLQKQILEVGCGIYLLSSSIIAFVTMIILAFKFSSLLMTQMGFITNPTFLNANCKLIEFLLKFLPTTSEWLNACVAIERVINVIFNIHFNKIKSKVWAKYLCIIIILMNIITALHDPIYRRLFEDSEEQRIWCIINYKSSTSLDIYNTTLNIIHFIIPFLINFISAVVIIAVTARKRSVTRKNQVYSQHLKTQFRQHRHLIISSCILVILTLPRLIISFFSGCMKSLRNPWLFLAGYYISFVPSILTFFIFIVPSLTYRQAFYSLLKHYRTLIQRQYRTY